MADILDTLQSKIQSKQAWISVLGLGYVGLPTLRCFFDAGFSVLGYDIDPAKVDSLKQGDNYLQHLGDDFIAPMTESDRFAVTSEPGSLNEADVFVICVPTPLTESLEPDLHYVERTTEMIASVCKPGCLVVLQSTSYPGTTRQRVQPILEKAGHVVGRDVYLAFSPEREDPGRSREAMDATPKVVGGVDEASGDLVELLMGQAWPMVVRVSSAEVAEAGKLLENIYRAVNIALVNEMKTVLADMDVDIWEVVQAAASKPFGYQPFYPGPGLGGHCIPIDPFYFAWKAKSLGHEAKFIELAGQVNRAMPEYVIERTRQGLAKQDKTLAGARVLVLGLAYKANVDDTRESPSWVIMQLLEEAQAKVDFHDPFFERTPKVRKFDFDKERVELTPESVAGYDAVVIATDHDSYDWPMLFQAAQLIVDPRGVHHRYQQLKGRIVLA